MVIMTILRVNLSSGEITKDSSYSQCWGRELIGKVLTEEVDPLCHPLAQENKLIITGGPLAGTGASSCGRLSIGAKSPLTGGIKEANAGGMAATYLAKWGIHGIIVEGEATALSTLIIGEDVELITSPELQGLRTGEIVRHYCEICGQKTSVICIGPVGEYRMLAAGIAVTDVEGRPSRFAARGGLGAVMGSKNLKAIAIRRPPRERKVDICNEDVYKQLKKKFHEILRKHPVTGESFPKFGTASVVSYVQELGGLPTKNFTKGRFEGAEMLSGEALRELILQRGGQGKTAHSCMAGCLVMCSNVFPDKSGQVLVSPLEYETIGIMGPNLGIGSLDDIAALNRECNELGLDTIEIGVALGMIMAEGIINFGDATGALDLLREIEQKSYLGRIIGSGAAVTGKVFGHQRIPVVLGQALPAYDPRAIKGLGVTYASNPMGADHTAGYTLPVKINHHSPEGQIGVSYNVQTIRAVMDTWGVCTFLQAALMENWTLLISMINQVQKTDYSVQDMEFLGRSIIKTERAFNKRAGITDNSALPDFLRTEPLPPYDLIFDVDNAGIEKLFTD
jgi:aldehyde:ferredoxin oxidoreductase